MNTTIFIIGILLIALSVFLIIKALVSKKEGKRGGGKKYLCVSAIGLVLVIVSMSFQIIPTGYSGVKATFGQISTSTLQKGLNWKLPIVDTIQLVNNKQQDLTYNEKVWGESKEKVVMFIEGVTITYQINSEKSAWIAANVSNYEDSLITPTLITSSLKNSCVSLISTEVTNRSIIEPLAKTALQEALDEKYGAQTIFVIKVVLNNIDFEDAYNQAIQAKQLAQQELEKQQVQNRTNIEKAQAEAKSAVLAAQGQADAKVALAQGEAKANALKNESLTQQILMQQYLEKWDGKLPTVTSDGSGLIFNLDSLTGSTTKAPASSATPKK